MRAFLLFVLVAFLLCDVAKAQARAPSVALEELYRTSELVIVGTVRSLAPVVSRDKILAGSHDSREYELGVEFEIDALEWIKADTSARKRKILKVFRLGSTNEHGGFLLLRNRRYLLFLRRNSLDRSTFADAMVVKSTKNIYASENLFDVTRYYEAVHGRLGVVSDPKLIERIRKELKK